MTITTRIDPPSLRDAFAVAELFVGFFRRDLLVYYPQCRLDPIPSSAPLNVRSGPNFRLLDVAGDTTDDAVQIAMFGTRYRLYPRAGTRFSGHDPANDPGDRRRLDPALPTTCSKPPTIRGSSCSAAVPRITTSPRSSTRFRTTLQPHAPAESLRRSSLFGPQRSRPTRTEGFRPVPCSSEPTRISNGPSLRLRPTPCPTASN